MFKVMVPAECTPRIGSPMKGESTMKKSNTQDAKKKKAYRDFQTHILGLYDAVKRDDNDSQLIYLVQAIGSLEDAKKETLKVHGGITQ